MELNLKKHHNALVMSLNSRMRHCQEELAEIAIQDDFIIIESQAFASKKLQFPMQSLLSRMTLQT